MVLAVLGSAVGFAVAPAQEAAVASAEEALVDSLLDRMTIEEKLGQLVQHTAKWDADLGAPRATPEHIELVRQGRVGSFLSIYGTEHLSELQRIAVEESRLGIPLLFAQDVIHGFRTIFPVPLAEAATWNPEAVERAARIAAIEATAAGVHWTFAPMVDVARDPRWGRIVEGSGEDPYLGMAMAAARVRGFQGGAEGGDLADPTTLMATAKHYVAYGGAEGGRDYNTVDISERTLHEIYLPPFLVAAWNGVASFMGGFNEIGGVPMHASEHLIDGLLREEWGWDGVFVSDYTAVLELIEHGIAGTRIEAGLAALQAGVDVDMVSGIYGEDLVEAVRAGQLDEPEVDQAVRRVLRAKHRLGLFEDPYRYSDPERERTSMLTEEHRRAAREVAREAIVLLQNDGTLPLEKGVRTLAVIGPLADDRDAPLGPWAGAGRAEDVVTVLEGIRRAVGEAATVAHAKGAEVAADDTTGFAEAARIAGEADAVVLVLGESRQISGEAASRHTLDLPGVQRELAERVLAAGKPTAVVLMNGRPLAIPWLGENAPAILETWFLGTETGLAVADVLFGDVSPSGKLPVTYPRHVGQVPIYYNHKNTGRPPSEEKYTSKYLELPSTPLYPFGHGLSYTTFEYGNARFAASGSDRVADSVAVDLTNTGDRAGTEVVQLYIRDHVASVTPAVMKLRDFRRVTLAPGETLTVSFPIDTADLAFYEGDGWWIAEPGTFTALVGGSSAETVEVEFEIESGSRFRYGENKTVLMFPLDVRPVFPSGDRLEMEP